MFPSAVKNRVGRACSGWIAVWSWPDLDILLIDQQTRRLGGAFGGCQHPPRSFVRLELTYLLPRSRMSAKPGPGAALADSAPGQRSRSDNDPVARPRSAGAPSAVAMLIDGHG